MACACLGARGQTPTPSPRPSAIGLTFESIYQIAERDNLLINAVRLRRAVAEADIIIAGERPNPDFITAYTRTQPRLNTFYSQLVELGGKRGRRIDVARNELQLTELELDAALRTLRHDVRAAYFNVLLARDNLDLGRDILAQAKQLAEIAQARFDAGDIAHFEVLQVNLGVARITNEVARLEDAERVARSTVNQLLNRAPDAPLDLSDTLSVKIQTASTPDLIQQALIQNVELKTAEHQIATEESRLRLARAQRVPDVTVQPGLEYFDSAYPGRPGFNMQVTVPLPIFNRQKGEIQKSNATLDQLRAERDATRQRIAAEVGRAALNLDSARRQVDFYETKLLPDAERVRQMAVESYQAGQTGILSVIDATRNARDVRQAYLQALLDYQSAVADLEQAAGVKF
ncbi:MAG TPA: TolC family protein [Xanthobacteraceae bacterium]|nr:TolC family protein [Xanthobacteraceae bacterium]